MLGQIFQGAGKIGWGLMWAAVGGSVLTSAAKDIVSGGKDVANGTKQGVSSAKEMIQKNKEGK